jgi:hypothetical protein
VNFRLVYVWFSEFSCYLFIFFISLCIVCSKLFQFEGEVLEYVFRLLVSSKLGLYDIYAPA